MTQDGAARLKIKAQILVGQRIAIGPGKADLLDAVEQTGSIAAAGRMRIPTIARMYSDLMPRSVPL